MKGYFDTPQRSEEELDAIIKNYRIIALACGVFIPLLGAARALTQPVGQDPYIERLVVSAACFLYAGLTLVPSSPVCRYPFSTIAGLCLMITAFAIHLAYLTNFTVNSAFAILLVTFTSSMLMRTRASLLMFQAATVVITTIIMLSVQSTEISTAYFLGTISCVCVFTYISQSFRMSMEENLRAARQQALDAAEARTRFLANMSHEIRTPMNGVIGMTHLLEQTKLDESQRSLLKTIQVSGDSLLNIINDILDFSKVDAGEILLDYHQFDLTRCIEDAAELVKTSCHEKGLNLYLVFEPGGPQSAVGDANRLRQVLINLLNNAIKFTAKGSVTLRAGGKQVGDIFQLECEVIDTGIGIAPDSIDHLFEAFSQADTSTTRKYGGTGLGLSISKHLIELMGGSISVSSAVDRGSTFKFWLPLSQPIHQLKPDNNVSALEHLRNKPTPLFVFIQNAIASLSIQNLLVDNKIDFDLAPDPTSAENMLRNAHYDYVLSDLETLKQSASCEHYVHVQSDCSKKLSDKNTIEQPFRPSRLKQLLTEANPKERACETNSSPLTYNRNVRILLAEDNIINQRVATKMLENFGYSVHLANDGSEALSAMREEDFDLVLMDLQMPELSGLEVTQKARSEGKDCPIIALTANAFEEDRQACFSAGMDAYLSKPLRKQALQDAISKVLPH